MSLIQQARIRNAFTKAKLDMEFKKQDAKKSFLRFLLFGFLILTIYLSNLYRCVCTYLILIILSLLFILNGYSFLITILRIFVENLFKPNEKCPKSIDDVFNIKRKNQLAKLEVSWSSCNKKITTQNENSFKLQMKPKSKKNFCSTPLRSEDFIADELSLRKYLQNYEKTEKIRNLNFSQEFRYEHHKTAAAKLLSTSVFQLSSNVNEKLIMGNRNSPDSNKKAYRKNQTEILKSITFEQLSHYVTNLKRWISITIVKPIVQQIDYINDIFDKRFIKIKIGNTDLELIRSVTSQTKFIADNLPTLPVLLHYLEICHNQIYLIKTLRKLANGAYMNDYSLKADERNLPNDAAIIFQCFCIYLDSQLNSKNDCKTLRKFSSKYVVINERNCLTAGQMPMAIRNSSKCAILCTNPLRPKFNLMTTGRFYESSYGLNNLFHVLIGFLVHIKQTQRGMLEGVNLGCGGINILCVIGELN